MKKLFLLMVAVAVLAGPVFLGAYDLTAHNWKVLPEAIYAAATGGGTWSTEVQITNATNATVEVNVYFYYDSGIRGSFLLTTLAPYNTYRTTNILNTIDNLDTGVFTYYGRVGAVWFWTSAGSAHRIHVTSKTMHSGGYGKSLPALYPSLGTTAAVGRPMIIPLMYNGSVNRSTCGFFNTSDTTSITATFYIVSNTFSTIASFSRTIPASRTLAFNPFIQAGIDANVYTNVWLYVYPTAGPNSTTERGLACFGSVVNNTTLDPTAVIAYPFILANTAAAAQATPLEADPLK